MRFPFFNKKHAVNGVHHSSLTNHQSGYLTTLGVSVIEEFKAFKEEQKRSLTSLNDDLSNYIKSVYFAQAKNKHLAKDIEIVRQITSVHKDVFNAALGRELGKIQMNIDETYRKRSAELNSTTSIGTDLTNTTQRVEELVGDYQRRRKINKDKIKQLANIRADVYYTEMLIAEAQDEKLKIHQTNERLRFEIRQINEQRNSQVANKNKILVSIEQSTGIFTKTHSEHLNELQDLIIKSREEMISDLQVKFNRDVEHAMRDVRENYEKRIRSEITVWQQKYEEIKREIKKKNDDDARVRNKALLLLKTLRQKNLEANENLKRLRTEKISIEAKIAYLEEEREERHHTYRISLESREKELSDLQEKADKLVTEAELVREISNNLAGEIKHYKELVEETKKKDVIVRADPVFRPVRRRMSGSNDYVRLSGDPAYNAYIISNHKTTDTFHNYDYETRLGEPFVRNSDRYRSRSESPNFNRKSVKFTSDTAMHNTSSHANLSEQDLDRLAASFSIPINGLASQTSQVNGSSLVNSSSSNIQTRSSSNILSGEEMDNMLSRYESRKAPVPPPRPSLEPVSDYSLIDISPAGISPSHSPDSIESDPNYIRNVENDVIIEKVEKNGKYVVLKNRSNKKTFDLGNWSLVNYGKKKEHCRYVFPIGTVLEPEASVKVTAQKNSDPFSHVVYGLDSFKNSEGCRIVLLDDTERVISSIDRLT